MTDARQAYLQSERDKWLSKEEAAFVLGVGLPVLTQMLQSGALPHRRVGKIARIHLESLKPCLSPSPKEVDRAPHEPSRDMPSPRVPLSTVSRRNLRAFEGGRPRRPSSHA